jgi:hypothetical protein
MDTLSILLIGEVLKYLLEVLRFQDAIIRRGNVLFKLVVINIINTLLIQSSNWMLSSEKPSSSF